MGRIPGEKLPAAQFGTGTASHSSIQVLSFFPIALWELLTIRFALKNALMDDYSRPRNTHSVLSITGIIRFFELLFRFCRKNFVFRPTALDAIPRSEN